MRRRWWSGWWRVALFVLAVFLALPGLALADSANTAATQLFPWQQLWPIVIGALVPLVTYALNHWAPWVSQPIKATVLLVVSAAATALYTALATNVIGFNAETLQLILTGIGAALAAHHLLWKPSGISTLLGAYGDYGISRRVGKIGAPGQPVPVAIGRNPGPLVPSGGGPPPSPLPGGGGPPPSPLGP